MVDRFFGEGRKPVFGVAIRVPEPPAFLIDRPESTEAARERMRGREDLFLGGVVYSPKAATSRTGFGSSAGDDVSLLELMLSELFFLAVPTAAYRSLALLGPTLRILSSAPFSSGCVVAGDVFSPAVTTFMRALSRP